MIIGTIVGTVLIVGITIAIGMFADRKLGLLPRPQTLAPVPVRPAAPTYTAGEAPATAIRAGTAQRDRLRTSQRCKSCRELMTAMDEDHVRYDGRDLIVVQFRCPRCDTKRALYVEPAS